MCIICSREAEGGTTPFSVSTPALLSNDGIYVPEDSGTLSPQANLAGDIAALRVYDVEWQTYMPGVTESGGKLNITFSFDATTTNQSNYNSDIGAQGRTNLNALQEAGTRQILDHYEEVIDVNFVETGTDTAAMKFWTGDLSTYGSQWGTIGVAYFPHSNGSDITMDNVAERATDHWDAGEFNYQVMVHEIGHAMGLSHPGNSGSNPSYSSDGTVMSYNAGQYATEGYNNGSYDNTGAQGLQIFDIAALQSVYGANTNFNSGNTTYTFDGSVYNKTIWDGGGNDTYAVAASYSGDVTIDLREGLNHRTEFGSTHIWTAFNADIENATTRDGDDTIYGNDLANTIRSFGGNDTIDTGANNDRIESGDGRDLITASSGDNTVIASAGHDTITTGDGRDVITSDDRNDLSGGNDIIDSGGGNDSIWSYYGDDTITSSGGINRLDAGFGNNSITGGTGVDRILAEDGNDTINSGAGNDYIIVTGGTNSVNAGDDRDRVILGDGDDTINGGSGNDTLEGRGGADSILGGDGIDYIYGEFSVAGVGAGDYIDGGDGNDRIWGAYGEDTLIGGLGNDIIHGDDDNDTITGGAGRDSIYGGAGVDTIDGGADNDLIYGEYSWAATGAVDSIDGGEGNDRIFGMHGDDTLNGGNGNDRLNGGNDDDLIYGNAGLDTLEGGRGSDVMYGGDDADRLFGDFYWDSQGGDDQMFGGAGNDRMLGYYGNDTLEGGLGYDRLVGGVGSDIFVFNDLTHSVGNTADLIEDFQNGTDQIDLSGLGFTGIAAGAASGTTLGFSFASGLTTIQSTGTFEIDLLGNHLATLDASDFIFV